ncbi:glutamate-1-semialdehyde 2,1-aminomutase [Kiloniella spongiae]|uniref:Glutamate-1-semialdehyde 2,1-aminomutase n=1 Tax=Kiloniella spongiae TaxID=1489064 RepID=A0A0H2M9G8_9PROT|nr:aminotransferase class III-fold pyridoxal phosphate-dependent enzyme [Kiloniella spongiae]KLN58938.1 glutamate-1-semialdehyde 2,1-aminomutase [Kiloniella spongiae]
MQKINTQEEWIDRAKAVLPAAGFGNFDPSIILKRGQGSRVWDENGNEFVDLLIGSGPMLLGHGHPEVQEAIYRQISDGLTFFTNNAAGIELAEVICDAMPCAEKVRYVTSGSEADMYAMRLARAFTGRQKILKFEGGYHGMSAEAQMSLAPTLRQNFPIAVPDSGGIPDSVQADILVAPFNDIEFLTSIISEFEHQIAGVIVEPLQRLIPPAPGFLETLRDLCTKANIVLIFDEIVTGFRLAYGGAQEAYGVVPDLCTVGKIVGGGFPLAALAGRTEIMTHFDKSSVANERWLMQLGTLSGNPLASIAGLKTLEILRREGSYDLLRNHGQRLMEMNRQALDATGIPYRIVGEPPLFDVVFTDQPVTNYRDHQEENTIRNQTFNHALRSQGILKFPGKVYSSLALTEDDFSVIGSALDVAAKSLI